MRTVQKPWGHEHWWVQTPAYVAKIIHINAAIPYPSNTTAAN